MTSVLRKEKEREREEEKERAEVIIMLISVNWNFYHCTLWPCLTTGSQAGLATAADYCWANYVRGHQF